MQLEQTAIYLRARFPQAALQVFFHRGIDGTRARLCQRLADVGIAYKDISDSPDGFHDYDQLDMHIGMRVHAHIYNLSIGHPSILLEEDARGAGVNKVLGLRQIKLYATEKQHTTGWRNAACLNRTPSMQTKLSHYNQRLYEGLRRRLLHQHGQGYNRDFLRELNDYITDLSSDDFYALQRALQTIQRQRNIMINHIKGFSARLSH